MRYFFLLPEIRSGGSEKFLINLINFYVKKKKDIFLLSINSNKKIFSTINPEVKFIELYNNPLLKLVQIIRLIFKYNPDKVFTILGISFYLFIIKILYKKKFILYCRLATNISAQYQSYNYYEFIKKFKLYIFSILLNRCEIIFTQSKSMKLDLLSFNPYLSTTKVKVIYNPINHKEIILKSSIINFDIEKYMNTKYILFVGRLEKVKNLQLLISLFEKIFSKIQDINLLIIGDGSEKNNLLKYIKKLKLNNKIKILGFKQNPYPYIKYSQLVISTSMYEGYSNIILESIILNKKLFVSDVKGGNEEIFKSKCKFFLFEYSDLSQNYINHLTPKLIKILEMPNKIEELNLLKIDILDKHDFNQRFKDYQIELDG